MFTIGGHYRMPNYQSAKYEPVELLLETQHEVSRDVKKQSPVTVISTIMLYNQSV